MAGCYYLESRGSHSFTAALGTEYDHNGDPIDMVCRDCGHGEHNESPLPRMSAPSNDWSIRTDGMVFAEDLNSDGTLKINEC